jgi:hypothetical protein
MKFLPACTVLLIAVACPRFAPAQTRIEFSNFSVGTIFPTESIPRTITADGIDIGLNKYNGASSSSGRIVDSQLFSSPNSALFLAASLRAEIRVPSPAKDGFFAFRSQGGSNLLEINGQTLNFADPSLAGSAFGTVGGVTVHSAPNGGSFRGVKIDGTINALAFIGQELTIDGVGLYLVPEPSALALAIIALAALPPRRRDPIWAR